MKKPIIGVVAILLLGLAVFAGLSFWGDGIDVGSTHIKTGSFAENMLTPPDTATSAAASVEDSVKKANVRQPLDTTSKVILFAGDSMLEELGPRMAAYATANGHTLINVIWYS